jgi:glycosyltransferase involved in cell wall biosynthesis
MTSNDPHLQGKIIKVAMLAEYPFEESELVRGGVMQANYRLIHALGKLGAIELYVLMPSVKTDTLVTRHEGNATVIFFPLKNQGYGSFLRYPGIRRSFKEILDRIRPDLLHAQAAPAYILSVLESRTPSVVTIHGIFRNELPVIKSRRSLRERLVAKTVTRLQDTCFKKIKNLIAITGEIEDLVREFSPAVRTFRINNAIDDRFFSLPDHDATPRVLFVGWINKRKGVHVLIEAFYRVIESLPEAKLRLIGQDDVDRDYAVSLRTKHKSLIASGSIQFCGSISQERLYEEMSRCSLLCLPSLAESAPMVIAQAMAASKPVVATRVGGISEMIEDGVTGLLCDPGNSEQLAASLLTLLQNPALRREMGQRARQRAEKRYRASAVAESTVEAYRSILGGLLGSGT